MLKKFSFWIWGTIILQFLTGAIHSISFFVNPQPQNDTEKQLMELTSTYKPDAGMGFHPSYDELFTGLSICFMLIFFFAAALNWYLKKKNITTDLWKGILLIETIIFGCMLVAMSVFTFAIPVICIGLIFVFILGAYFTGKNLKQ